MIRTLRRKFIFFAMAAVSVLLLILILSINGLAWFMFEQQSNEIMNTLVNSEGNFMNMNFPDENKWKMPNPIRDMMRSARFFTVTINDSGVIMFANIDEIFFVSMDDAMTYARQVIEKNTDSGRIDRYKYKIKNIIDGKKIFFLDMTREMMTRQTLLLVSLIIAAGSWLAVLLFVILLSARVVRPIIAGMEKQKQFITNAGHELKTPLAIIQSNNDAMSLIYGENKYNINIKGQVIRLSKLTANLLMQAKLDEEIELQKEQINISELTEEIIRPYADSAEAKDISFQYTITPGITYNTNLQAFTQVLTILMDNAIKYTNNKGDILFTLAENSRHIEICEENSCDIDQSMDPELLFERFYRADSARTQEDQNSGYGIGLSVARSICDSLGGKLTADYPTPGRIRFIARL